MRSQESCASWVSPSSLWVPGTELKCLEADSFHLLDRPASLLRILKRFHSIYIWYERYCVPSLTPPINTTCFSTILNYTFAFKWYGFTYQYKIQEAHIRKIYSVFLTIYLLLDSLNNLSCTHLLANGITFLVFMAGKNSIGNIHHSFLTHSCCWAQRLVPWLGHEQCCSRRGYASVSGMLAWGLCANTQGGRSWRSCAGSNF